MAWGVKSQKHGRRTVTNAAAQTLCSLFIYVQPRNSAPIYLHNASQHKNQSMNTSSVRGDVCGASCCPPTQQQPPAATHKHMFTPQCQWCCSRAVCICAHGPKVAAGVTHTIQQAARHLLRGEGDRDIHGGSMYLHAGYRPCSLLYTSAAGQAQLQN